MNGVMNHASIRARMQIGVWATDKHFGINRATRAGHNQRLIRLAAAITA